MKHALIAIGLFISMSPLAIASPTDTSVTPLNLSPGTSAFANLKALYNAGHVPSASDFTTWRSGRCFRAETPSSPQNSLLVSVAETSDTVGPVMPKHDVFRVITYTDEAQPAAFYDVLSPEQKSQLSDELTVTKNTYSEADLSNGAVHDRSVGDSTFQWFIRKNGDTLVMEYWYFNEIQSMCYYYNAVN